MKDVAVDIGNAVAQGVRFEAAVEAALSKHPLARRITKYDPAIGGSSFGLKEEYLLPEARYPVANLTCSRGGPWFKFAVGERLTATELGRLLLLCASGLTERKLRAELDERLDRILDAFLATGIVAPSSAPPIDFAPRGVPGVTRLQHASLLFQSATTGVLVDPHLHTSYEPSTLKRNIRRHDLDGRVQAILLSHSHSDHYDLATLCTFARDTPIVVPKVPRDSLLCENMAARLRSLGFTRVIDVPWYAPPIVVGDIEIEVLPFYGEQPLVGGITRDPAVRNWGNTYFLKTPAYTAWILIDSGDDAAGRSVHVARHVRTTYGGVDLVFSNLRTFYPFTPTYITGAGHYWFALPPDIMADFSRIAGECLTLGPRGVADVCAAAGARSFLPYAHLWAEPGQHAEDELDLVAELETELTCRQSPTRVIRWRVGDFANVEGGVVERIPSPLADTAS
jgi:hypothetical protein